MGNNFDRRNPGPDSKNYLLGSVQDFVQKLEQGNIFPFKVEVDFEVPISTYWSSRNCLGRPDLSGLPLKGEPWERGRTILSFNMFSPEMDVKTGDVLKKFNAELSIASTLRAGLAFIDSAFRRLEPTRPVVLLSARPVFVKGRPLIPVFTVNKKGWKMTLLGAMTIWQRRYSFLHYRLARP